MKILVTGATGFIGQHVVRWLVEHNYSVIASGTSVENAEKIDWYNAVEFKPCDYYNSNIDYLTYFGRIDILIHLGWMNIYQNTVEVQLGKNLIRTINFLQNMSKEGGVKIVGIGSSQEYGNISGCLKENQCVNPVTPYGVAKNTLRSYVELLAKEKGLEWNWIRLFHQIGDGQNPKSFQGQLELAVKNNQRTFPMSSGEQMRDFLPVETAAEFICKISLQKKINGIVNCCSGIPQTLKDYAQQYIVSHKSPLTLELGAFPYRENEPLKQWGDTALLNQCVKKYGEST